MEYEEWRRRNAAEYLRWREGAPFLSEEEATAIFDEVLEKVVSGTPHVEALQLLRDRGIWVSLLPEEGLEDVSVDPRPTIRTKPNGATRRLKLKWEQCDG